MRMKANKAELITHGFSGYLAVPYHPAGRGIVIILGGESVMMPLLKPGKWLAEYMAKKGFTAVSVSLFGAEGLPDSPDRIPLEYAVNAAEYLKKQMHCSRISVFGMSMGSIAALGTALYSDVNDLVMMSPSHAAFEGVSKDKKTMTGHSFLTWKGQDIPYVSADIPRYPMYEAYEKAYADKEREEAAMKALPVNEVKARILFLAGSRDHSWPSEYSVHQLCRCLEQDERKHSYCKVIYPEYGHMLPLKKEVMKQVMEWLDEPASAHQKERI